MKKSIHLDRIESTMKLIKSCVLVLSIAACTNASAGISLKAYRDLMKEPETARLAKTYMQGVMEGLRVSNSVSKANGQKMTFCEADENLLPASEYQIILAQELAKPTHAKTYADNYPVEIILSWGMISKYPCR